MEYVYLLTNDHVPKLVKFGFSRRDPCLRATELSAPTGVPGRWRVHHFWEVEDGYSVEQAVFSHLAHKRLGRQEFLEMDAADAITKISTIISNVGTNPMQRAQEEAKLARDEALQRALEKKAAQEKIHAIQLAIKQKIEPVEEVFAYKRRKLRILLTIIFFLVGFYGSYGLDYNPLLGAFLVIGIGWLALSLPIVAEHVLWEEKADSQAIDRFREEAFSQILGKHMLSISDYAELRRKAFPKPPMYEDSNAFENIDAMFDIPESAYEKDICHDDRIGVTKMNSVREHPRNRQ